MENLNNYSINELIDYNRLSEISSMVHETLVESRHIIKGSTDKINLYPHLNNINQTTVLIAELNNNIIGTNSMTIDSEHGLHTDLFFKQETDYIRKSSEKKLGSSWRIATNKEYRGNIRLFLDIIQNSFFLAKKKGIETCLFVFDKKHEKLYKKLLDAETISEKVCNIEAEIDINMVLMKTDTENSQKHLNKIFIRRKF